MEAKKKKIIIVFPHLPWSFPCDFIKQTTLELAKKARVIVYNALDFPTLKNLICDKERRREWLSLFKEKNLSYFPSLAIIPFQRFKWIERLNISINRFLFRLFYFLKFGFEKPIFWTFCYPLEGWKNYLGWQKLLVYDRPDQISSLDTEDNREIEKADQEFLKMTDVVFSNSPYALKYIKKYNKKSFIVCWGCNLNLFSARKLKTPSVMKGIARPILGFSGGINHRLDFQILYTLAKKRGDWSFVLVGGFFSQDVIQFKIANVKGWLRKLEKLPNVYLLGQKKKEEMPAFIANFDVCLIPYNVSSEFVRGGNPTKLYEYLAMGKPVVSTAISAVEQFSPTVRIAKDVVGFNKAIEESLEEAKNKKEIKKRKAIASRNAWEKKVEEMWDKLNMNTRD